METTFQQPTPEQVQWPTPEQVQWHVEQARRLRAETVHAVLKSAGAWLMTALRTRTPERGDVVRGKIARA